MNKNEYANLVEEITTTRIDVTKAASNPMLEPGDMLRELEDVGEWLKKEDGQANAESPKARAKDATPPASKKRPANTKVTAKRAASAPNTAAKRPRKQAAATATPATRAQPTPKQVQSTGAIGYTCIVFPEDMKDYKLEHERPSNANVRFFFEGACATRSNSCPFCN